MRAAALAAVVCAAAVAGGCGSNSATGFEHPRVLKGFIEQPDQERLALKLAVSVDFVSNDLGYLATQAGVILRTNDGGLTWTPAEGRLENPTRIDFVTPTRGFALTARNVLLVTDDAARSWRPLHRFPTSRRDKTDVTVDFVDPEHGWIVPIGGPLYRTQDGGQSWVSLSLPCDEFESSVGPSFFDRERGYLVCGGQPAAGWQQKSFYSTSDAGATWKARSQDWRGGFGYAHQLAFRSPDEGLFFTNRGGLSRTDAAGSSRRLLLFTSDVEWVTDIAWPSATRIYAATFHAGLLRSDDGGAHWRRLYGGDRPPPNGPLTFSSPTQGIGFGAEDFIGGPKAVFWTHDGGRAWHRIRADHPMPLADQVFRFGDTIITANGGGLTRSEDSGRHWRRVLALRPARSGWFSFVSAKTGYRAEGKSLYRTDDGGSTWTLAHRGDVDLYGVVFMTEKDAFVVDYGDPPPDDGKKHMTPIVNELLESHDGGEHWELVKAPLMGTVNAMHRLDDEHWWLFANVSCPRVAEVCGGQVWRTADGGANWELIELPRPVYASPPFSFVSPKVGFAGRVDALYRTEDGGVTWSYVYPA